jgi:hypothetical protein
VSAGPRTAKLDATKHWAGYGWFMSFGTLLPLVVFLGSYVVHLTLIGAPIARALNRFGIWISTFGQAPPGKDKVVSRKDKGDKKSLIDESGRTRPRVMSHGAGGPSRWFGGRCGSCSLVGGWGCSGCCFRGACSSLPTRSSTRWQLC